MALKVNEITIIIYINHWHKMVLCKLDNGTIKFEDESLHGQPDRSIIRENLGDHAQIVPYYLLI